MLIASAYCLWYFLMQYGVGLFKGSMLIIGIPALFVVGALVASALLHRDWSKLSAA